VQHRRLPVVAILDRWLDSGHHYFEVKAEDGRCFLLRHAPSSDHWELAAVYRNAKSARPRVASARPRVAVVDSIQTLWTETLQSAPGSVAQVRECAAQLTRHAKRAGTALFLIGHVTKEGAIAGPRVLEHIVDTVLYFEGDPNSAFRLVRGIEAGIVWINCFDEGDMTQPFGGYKQSGNARDKCLDSFKSYLQTKSAWFRLKEA